VADHDPRDVPDLDLPPRAPTAGASVPSTRPKSALHAPAPANQEALGGDFGMELEHGPAVSAPPGRMTARAPAQQVSIEIGDGGDGFDMEIERGGAMISRPAASSGRRSGPASTDVSERHLSTGLDVAYRRMDAQPVVAKGPSSAQKVVAWMIPVVLFLGTIAGLVKLVHRAGGRNVMNLVPHAFDASSTAQSGAFAGGSLVLAITIGFCGLKLHPRSYAMLGSASTLLIASLAMVTVTLVSTDEHPAPPDGALLIPYVVPLAIFLLGVGVAGRGPSLFLRRGARRLGSVVASLAGGAIAFAAIEVSALASRLH
jgi:hypothetical protein